MFLSSYPVFGKELGDFGIPDEWTLICMDLLELELPDDDQSDDLVELPDIEKIESAIKSIESDKILALSSSNDL